LSKEGGIAVRKCRMIYSIVQVNDIMKISEYKQKLLEAIVLIAF
jgi:hypothetical protein